MDNDYTELEYITFLANEREACANVAITPDTRVEPNELFTLTISSGVNVITGNLNTATVTIIDDDSKLTKIIKRSREWKF